MPGIDPVSGIASAAQFGLGAIQSLIGGVKARKYQKQLENLQTPRYDQSKSIMDYYNQALQRYNQNPYQSQQYQYAQQMQNRNMAAGVNSLQNRASAVGGIARLQAIGNDSALKAGMAAEQEQSRRFGELGSAAQMKQGEDRASFQYNQIAPYEKKYNLLAMRAGAGNQLANTGGTNMMNALGSLQDYANIDKVYGKQG